MLPVVNLYSKCTSLKCAAFLVLLRRMLTTAVVIFAAGSSAYGASPVLRTLHSFAGEPGDGATPYGSLVLGAGNVLYGVTYSGGAGPCAGSSSGCGMAFSLAPPTTPGGVWTETVLHTFTGENDGAFPIGGLVMGSGGVLYGTTTRGGGTSNWGVIFSLTPPTSSGGAWTEAVLHDFTGGSDGGYPEASMAIGEGGLLYGTTMSGGTSLCGTVFSLTPPPSPGGSWIETVLHDFDCNGTYSPVPLGVTVGSTGVIYGVAGEGGTAAYGSVFALKPPATPGGVWAYAVLHSFTGNDGGFLAGGLAVGRRGVLYGSAVFYGGSGGGTVFSLTPPKSSGGTWIETVLYNFGAANGAGPTGVVIGDGGVLYGVTQTGGASGNGTVFSLTPPSSPGGAWTEAVLYSFTGARDGGFPQGCVAIGHEGLLYGTTAQDGSFGFGTTFVLKP